MLYGQLSQRNPDPDHAPAFLRELQDFYEGGYSIERRAKEYLPRLADEPAARHQDRLSIVAPVSYAGMIVDSLAANLFSQAVAVHPAADATDPNTVGVLPDTDFYAAFSANADLQGTAFADVIRKAFTCALVKRRCYLQVDFPCVDQPVQSLADEDAAGKARAYCFEVPPEHVLNWAYSSQIHARQPIVSAGQKIGSVEFDLGKFSWLVLRQVRMDDSSPEADQSLVTEEFMVWRSQSGVVTWERWETPAYDPAKTPPKKNDELIRTGGAPTSFREIPVVELKLPHGLWVGGKVTLMNREHYRRRSVLVSGEQTSLYEKGVLKLGPEMSAPGQALPAEVAQNPRRGQGPNNEPAPGMMMLGTMDDFRYVGPSGAAFVIVNQQLKELVDEMFRVVHMMAASVSSTANSVGRSGASKAEDRNATTVVLGAYGAIARATALRVYDVIAGGRGEKVVWRVSGLDSFDAYDRSEVIAEAKAFGDTPILSPTLRKEWASTINAKLVQGLNPETQATIKAETNAAIDAQPQGGLAGAMEQLHRFLDPQEIDVEAVVGAVQTAAVSSAAAMGAAPPGGPQAPAPAAPRGQAPKPAASPPQGPQPGAPTGSPVTVAPPDLHQRGDSSSAGIAETVYRQLADDYAPTVIAWVRAATWRGPLLVNLDQIDFSNSDKWQASKDTEQVASFTKKIANEGYAKPLILVNEANNEKLRIVDGHHRALAYAKLDQPAMAYVADVGTVSGIWEQMHSSQRNGMQTSMQVSRQKSAA